MPQTVPTPMPFVGDTDTLRRDLQRAEFELASIARCLGRSIAAGETDLDHWHTALAEVVARFDRLGAEDARRLSAFWLANPESAATYGRILRVAA